MNFEDYSNKELIAFLAQNHGHDGAWKEFIERIYKFVCYVIESESRRIGFKEGVTHVDDLAHNVYINLLKDNSAALKRIISDFENAVFDYIKKSAIHEVYNRSAEEKAIKRGGDIVKYSLEQMIELLGRVPIDPSNSARLFELRNAINYCLDHIFKEEKYKESAESRAKKQRDMLILRFHIFLGLKAAEIVRCLHRDIAVRTIHNIITPNMELLRICLRENGFDN